MDCKARNLGSPLLDQPSSGMKRPFYDRSAISQAHGRQDLTPKSECDLLTSYYATSGVSSTSPRGGDVRGYPEVFDNDSHIEKRSRTSDWPLRSNIATCKEAPSISPAALRDQYDTLDSASLPFCALMKPRSSRFVEGSMNDRASQKPHPWYISDSEQSGEQFEAGQNFDGDTQTKSQLQGPTHQAKLSVALSAAHVKSEVSRPSSIYRFGKSVAAAFNLSSWKIWSKQQEEDAQDKWLLRERHEKAEKIYKELKRTGQFSGSAHENPFGDQDKDIPFNKHDSGVNLEHRSSGIDSRHPIGSKTVEAKIEEKRYGRVFVDHPSTCSFTRGESPALEMSVSLRNSSSQDRESTLMTSEMFNGPQALRRLPSRKDLQKQQKLVKRVSDLEGKLEAARRQLAEALGEPVPVQAARISRPRFTAGTLASLPSERLLGVYTAPESNFGNADVSVEFGKAISINNRTGHIVSTYQADKSNAKDLTSFTSQRRSGTVALEDALVGSIVARDRPHAQRMDHAIAEDGQIEHAVDDAHQGSSDNLTSVEQATKKRKSIGVGADHVEADEPTPGAYVDDSSEYQKPSISKRGPGRPRKLQKVDPEPKSRRHDPIEANHNASRTVVEANSPRSSPARAAKSPKDSRAVLSKKAATSADNRRIPRKVRYSASPPPPVSSSGIPYTGQEVSIGKIAEQSSDGEAAVRIVPSADVPSVPEIPAIIGRRKALSAINRIAGSCTEISFHDSADGDQKRSQTMNTDVQTIGPKSKQAFEWPADVF